MPRRNLHFSAVNGLMFGIDVIKHVQEMLNGNGSKIIKCGDHVIWWAAQIWVRLY
ncbi:hypothetical protein [Sporolactobacillus putidus]|uniref:Uncharacterized protein n=1 Tax=Sporolactobacillus putidus TaxID=492735 RepID=A0A917S1V3_9BACL|nr:hypothetical protein [Sporolactobacillus putidus]GGL50915.1 hypothetical protein GCM10007968_13930 [Sporolactobacillus putidus]